MALWTGLGQAATVAQLVGADVGGLVSMIVQSALTARQNKSECKQLARRVLMIAQLLPHVQEPEAVQPLAGLGDTLRDAHELVMSCQGRSAAYQFVMANRIDSYLILFPVISHIGITRRLERIYNVLVQDESTRDESSSFSQPSQLQESTEVVQQVQPQETKEFTLAEIIAATNNFARDTLIGYGSHGRVYRGRLHDGRVVAIKRMGKLQSNNIELEDFRTELNILSQLRHKHITRLLGWCVSSKEKRLLTWRRKEPERLIVYEYMENGMLSDHLHPDQGSTALSPVTVSWKMHIDVLLGVSRTIEHLQCHANPPIIHHDIKPANILFDASWVPCLSDFGSSLPLDTASEESPIEGTLGYHDPMYYYTGRLSLMIDVYSLGVVMLEVLTGKKPYFQVEGETNELLVDFALPIIEAGNVEELLDKRPVPEPTPWHLQVLKRVAQVARCCVKLVGEERPAISDVVANLEMAHELICRDEPCSIDDSDLWPFLVKVDESQGSPCASSNASWATGSPTHLESEVLEEGR